MGVRRHGVAMIAAAGVLGLVLAGCGTGQDAPTSLDLPSVPGVNVAAEDDSILIRNAHVEFSQEPYPAGGEAPVRIWLVNQTPEPIRLVSVASVDDESGTFADVITDGEVEVLPAGIVETTLQLTNLRRTINGVVAVPLTLAFDNDVTLAIQITMAPADDALPRERIEGVGH